MWRLRNRFNLMREMVHQINHIECLSAVISTAKTCKFRVNPLNPNKIGLWTKVRPVSCKLDRGVLSAESFSKLTIKQAVLNESKNIVHIIFEGGEQLDFPIAWLRDNCQCPNCFDKLSHSRIHDQQLFNCDLSLREILSWENYVRIIWEDGHISEYSREWLCSHSFADEHRRERSRKRFPDRISWNARDFYGSTQVFRNFPVADILTKDNVLLEWLEQLAKYGISLLTASSGDPQQLAKIADRVAFIRKTHYGVRFSVIGSDDADNVAYKKGALQLHTDLPYYHHTPGIIMLHCIKESEHGGENVLSDGLNAASALPDATFQILANTVIDWVDIGCYQDKRFYSLNREPVLCLNASGQLEKINWSQPQRDSIFNTSLKEAIEWYKAATIFTKIIHDKNNSVMIKTKAGNILTFDNRRILHGRKNYTDASRLLYGIYIDWDEIYSRIRVLKNMII